MISSVFTIKYIMVYVHYIFEMKKLTTIPAGNYYGANLETYTESFPSLVKYSNIIKN